MTTYAWPSTAAHPWYLLRQTLRMYHNNRSSVSPLSGFTQTLALPGARWGWALDVPEHTYAERAQLEGFFARLNGNEHRLQLWDMTRPRPMGNLAVSGVTLSAAAAQFATTLQLTGCLAGSNLFAGGGFEIDTNADGLADGWSSYVAGSVGSGTYTRVGGFGSAYAQRSFAAGSFNTGDRLGIGRPTLILVVAGASYVLSAHAINNAPAAQVVLYIGWHDSSNAFLGASSWSATGVTAWTRLAAAAAVAPAGATRAYLYIWAEPTGAQTDIELYVDNVLFEQAASASAYPGLPTLKSGDWLSVGGQLLMAAEDATATDAGAMTVPVRHMLRAAAASGAAVTLDKPTGLFIMAEPAMEWPRSAGNMAPETSVEMVEVFA